MMTCTAVYSDARARVHAQIVHVLIVLLSLLCTKYMPTPYSLATVIATLTCMRVSSCQQSCICALVPCNHHVHQGISMHSDFICSKCHLHVKLIKFGDLGV